MIPFPITPFPNTALFCIRFSVRVKFLFNFSKVKNRLIKFLDSFVTAKDENSFASTLIASLWDKFENVFSKTSSALYGA